MLSLILVPLFLTHRLAFRGSITNDIEFFIPNNHQNDKSTSVEVVCMCGGSDAVEFGSLSVVFETLQPCRRTAAVFHATISILSLE